jgi:hypothetical protein
MIPMILAQFGYNRLDLLTQIPIHSLHKIAGIYGAIVCHAVWIKRVFLANKICHIATILLIVVETIPVVNKGLGSPLNPRFWSATTFSKEKVGQKGYWSALWRNLETPFAPLSGKRGTWQSLKLSFLVGHYFF